MTAKKKLVAATAAGVLAVMSLGASAASAAGPDIEVSPDPAFPGTTVQVSGADCVDGDGNEGSVTVEVDGEVTSATVDPDGSWRAWIAAPWAVGTYDVSASCDAYYGAPIVYNASTLTVEDYDTGYEWLELELSHASVPAGAEQGVRVEGFAPGAEVIVRLGLPTDDDDLAPAAAAAVEGTFNSAIGNWEFGTFTADAHGVLETTLRVPAELEPREYAIGAFGADAGAVGTFTVTAGDASDGGGTGKITGTGSTTGTTTGNGGKLATTGGEGMLNFALLAGAAVALTAGVTLVVARRRGTAAE
ncbi:hypothetical protein [Leucobacter triazinivorans]|uniref:hypothetical protein n=1 Tax=Leucobacter triazinivorans TaxID=1784719 RepID=UPI0013EE5C08|nr:hypothetical protein [Leucobacter triazinivorans]